MVILESVDARADPTLIVVGDSEVCSCWREANNIVRRWKSTQHVNDVNGVMNKLKIGAINSILVLLIVIKCKFNLLGSQSSKLVLHAPSKVLTGYSVKCPASKNRSLWEKSTNVAKVRDKRSRCSSWDTGRNVEKSSSRQLLLCFCQSFLARSSRFWPICIVCYVSNVISSAQWKEQNAMLTGGRRPIIVCHCWSATGRLLPDTSTNLVGRPELRHWQIVSQKVSSFNRSGG